jgi:MYXO-CTERM domain-containing protein
VACNAPMRGRWGGPDGVPGQAPQTKGSSNMALVGAPPQPGNLSALLAESIPALDVSPDPAAMSGGSGGSGGKGGATGSTPSTPGGAGGNAAKGGSNAGGSGGAATAGSSTGSPESAPKSTSSCSCQLAGQPGDTTSASLITIAATALLTWRRRQRRRA